MCGTMIPTKPIEPGDSDRRCRPERRGDDEREPDSAHVDPEARRLVVAEIEDVDDAPERDDHDDRHRDVREDQRRRPTSPCSGCSRGSTSRPPAASPSSAAGRTSATP